MTRITVLNNGQIITAKKGSNLMKTLKKNGIKIASPCGGKGTCKKCKIDLEVITGEEKVFKEVLSCKMTLDEDIRILVKDESQFVDKKSALVQNQIFKTSDQIRRVPLKLDKATLKHEASIVDRIEKALNQEIDVSLGMMHRIGSEIGTNAYDGYAILEENALLDISVENEPLLGAAIDIGTTTMVLYLVNLVNGKVEGIASASNPQSIYGADVISRISYATESEENRIELMEIVRQGIMSLSEEVLAKTGRKAQNVYKATVCGNTTMMHMYLGLDTKRIALAPYLATYRSIQSLPASNLGLNWNQEARVHLLPNIAGYIGADTVSVILANKLDKTKKNIMALDLGTNGELALAAGGKVYTCATAAGPAFEGASIEFGMRADRGAIEALDIVDGEIRTKTIDDAKPIGICGSGLIDGVAKLLDAGLIRRNGRIADLPDGHPLSRWLGTYKEQKAIKLYENLEEPDKEVWLTQKDIRELQLAKGAMLAGMNVLMSRAGIDHSALKAIYLAGAFGSYVDIKSALGIGMFPKVDQNKIVSVGNSAGLGAIITLLSPDERKRAIRISDKAKYIELSTDQEFNAEFAMSMSF